MNGRLELIDCSLVTAGPALSMLWEPDDPAEVLGKRFGFADVESAVGWLGDVLSETWAITLDHCDRLVMSNTHFGWN
jgi:hypothetical protein